MSLTNVDLKAIQSIVDKSVDKAIDGKVPKIVRQVIAEDVLPRFDELELRIGQGFNDVHEQFQAVDRRFEEVDRRFDEVDRRFDQAVERLDGLELTTARINGNIAGLRRSKALAKQIKTG